MTKELKPTKGDNVTTMLAHVYPKITYDNESNGIYGIFGHVKPDLVASTILDGIARNRSVIYLPEYMIYISFWLKFLPTAMVERIDGLLFDDKKA